MMAILDKNAGAFKIRGNWLAQSRHLKLKFEKLTDADLKFEIGKENDLLNRVEIRLNKKREEVLEIIKNGIIEKV